MPKKDDEPTQKVDMAAVVASEKALAEQAPEQSVAQKEPAISISFDRYFATTGKPQHHKAGMKAYTKTDGRKTVAQWDAIFANY